jgi:hypothetical protein
MAEESEKVMEKPVYESPIVVDLNAIQRGSGGVPAGCVAGTSFISPCVVGAGEVYECTVGAVGAS